jgi:disease resistance protein RPS2
MLNQLHDLLEKGELNIIGVWGQGGVGKTTLLHVFNNNLEKAHNYQVLPFTSSEQEAEKKKKSLKSS